MLARTESIVFVDKGREEGRAGENRSTTTTRANLQANRTRRVLHFLLVLRSGSCNPVCIPMRLNMRLVSFVALCRVPSPFESFFATVAFVIVRDFISHSKAVSSISILSYRLSSKMNTENISRRRLIKFIFKFL